MVSVIFFKTFLSLNFESHPNVLKAYSQVSNHFRQHLGTIRDTAYLSAECKTSALSTVLWLKSQRVLSFFLIERSNIFFPQVFFSSISWSKGIPSYTRLV